MNTTIRKNQSGDTVTRATNSAPGVNDDVSLGYAVGSLWFDTTSNILYSCTDATNGAAVWALVAGSGGGSGFGSWATPITQGVPYQAMTDGFVVVTQNCTGGGVQASIEILTDAAAIPTTVRAEAATVLNGGASYVTDINATCPVKSGDYVLVNIVNTGGSGSIYWLPTTGGGSGTKITIDTTSKTITNASTTESYTVAIPGGELGTNNGFRFRLLLGSLLYGAGGGTITLSATYGGTAIGAPISHVSTNNGTTYATFLGEVVASGATNTQVGRLESVSLLLDGGGQTPVFSQTDPTLAVDSTISQNLIVSVQSTLAIGLVFQIQGIIVERIS